MVKDTPMRVGIILFGIACALRLFARCAEFHEKYEVRIEQRHR